VQDTATDGHVAYTVILAPATSTDENYDGIDPADVGVTNYDDDPVGPADPESDPPGFDSSGYNEVFVLYKGTVEAISAPYGVTLELTGYVPGEVSYLAIGSDSTQLPGLCFDGTIDEAGETYDLTTPDAGTDLAGGVAVWTGIADCYYADAGWTFAWRNLNTRLILTATLTDGETPVSLVDVTTLSGAWPSAVAVVAPVAGDVWVNLRMEAQAPSSFGGPGAMGTNLVAGQWYAALVLYDNLHTTGEDIVVSEFYPALYYVP
jgi:hypothetical protein